MECNDAIAGGRAKVRMVNSCWRSMNRDVQRESFVRRLVNRSIFVRHILQRTGQLPSHLDNGHSMISPASPTADGASVRNNVEGAGSGLGVMVEKIGRAHV